MNKCIVLDWVQLLSYGQVCLNKHGVLPTQKFWENHAMKTALTCKETIESSLELPQKSRSFRKHKYGANTTIRTAKTINKKQKIFNNKQIILQQPWSTSNLPDCGHQRRLPWGINTLHAKLSNCEAMWSVAFKVCYTYIHTCIPCKESNFAFFPLSVTIKSSLQSRRTKYKGLICW